MADIRYNRFLWTFGIALAMLLFVAEPASAQDQPRDVYGNDSAAQKQDGSVGLPTWAQPSNNSSGTVGSQPPDAGTNDPPTLPDDPSQVPIDGGLALLAAAGAGYAVRRLRKGQSDEDEESVA